MHRKMIDGSTASGFQSSSSQAMQMYGFADNNDGGSSSGLDGHSNSLLYKLSLLKDKFYQVQTLVNNVIVNNTNSHHQPSPMSMASISTLIQEIIVTASSMMFTCQQMMSIDSPNLGQTSPYHNLQSTMSTKPQAVNRIMNQENHHNSNQVGEEKQAQQQVFFGGESLEWFGDHHHLTYSNSNSNFDAAIALPNMNKEFPSREATVPRTGGTTGGKHSTDTTDINCDIIELDAADLLAKYTHYCQICGKGFKRDANLRMHMRAHGDEYKSSAALSNPMKNSNSGISNGGAGNPSSLDGNNSTSIVKYSCPQEGCKWNKKHAKFQPLKSMICVKNHFKRSHCPKMYVCKRCNQKQFSVLSDLRTHEKHCGDLKWQCSCGTTFSRKDKLMGHVALFIGHTPVAVDQTSSRSKLGRFQQQTQSDNR